MKATRFTTNILFLGVAALCLLASCKKDKNGSTAGQGFKATTEERTSDSKTYLDGKLVKWSEGEAIKVVNGNGDELAFPLQEGATTQTGHFYFPTTEHDDFFVPNYVAAYPSSASISGTTVTFDLPIEQPYFDGGFANTVNPMVAYATDKNLPFKNVLGGLCLPFTGTQHITRIVLTSANTNDKLWGTCTTTVSTTGGDPVSVVTNEAESKHILALTCDLTLSSTPINANFMVPAGTLQSGFTVTLFDGDTQVFQKEMFKNFGPNFISRSVISKLDTSIEVINVLTYEVTVTTASPTWIEITTAKGGGNVTLTGTGGTITERGICWALETETNLPTLDNNTLAIGSGVGSYASTTTGMSGMTKDQVYYVRAYAKDAYGNITYGNAIPFATRKDYANDYQGRIPFAYSVGTGTVQFSMGNLYYMGASGGTWKFADHQFDYLTNDAEQTSQVVINGLYTGNPNVNRDRFCFATSNQNHNSGFYQPWSTGWYDNKYYFNCFYAYATAGSGIYTYGLRDSNHTADWGYNRISNGGNALDNWHTLNGPTGTNATGGECSYLLNSRSGYGYAIAHLTTVQDNREINGLLIFPDGFSFPTQYYPSEYNNIAGHCNGNVYYTTNTLNEAQWSILEKFGTVFLPAAGVRAAPGDLPYPIYNYNQAYLGGGGINLSMLGVNDLGAYWLATPVNYHVSVNYIHSFALGFEPNNAGTIHAMGDAPVLRNYGLAVRLVHY